MATIIGCSTATTQIGQLCAARYNIRVAGFQAMAVNDRSQSCSAAEMRSRAAMPGQGHRYSAWGRDNNTIISGRMPSSGSQSRGWWGNFLQIFRPSSANAFNSFGNNQLGEDVRDQDSREREPAEWLQPEVEPAQAADQTLKVVEVTKAAQNTGVAEKAVEQGSNVANSALDKVGDVLRTTGLEINLDVGLKELTIKELVLKDLGLVLEVKTKPRPQASQAEAPPVAERDEGGNNAA